MENLRKAPLTISILVASFVAVCTIVGISLKAKGEMEGLANRAVVTHQQADMDIAHPSTKYTRQALDDIRSQLLAIREHLAGMRALGSPDRSRETRVETRSAITGSVPRSMKAKAKK